MIKKYSFTYPQHHILYICKYTHQPLLIESNPIILAHSCTDPITWQKSFNRIVWINKKWADRNAMLVRQVTGKIYWAEIATEKAAEKHLKCIDRSSTTAGSTSWLLRAGINGQQGYRKWAAEEWEKTSLQNTMSRSLGQTCCVPFKGHFPFSLCFKSWGKVCESLNDDKSIKASFSHPI